MDRLGVGAGWASDCPVYLCREKLKWSNDGDTLQQIAISHSPNLSQWTLYCLYTISFILIGGPLPFYIRFFSDPSNHGRCILRTRFLGGIQWRLARLELHIGPASILCDIE